MSASLLAILVVSVLVAAVARRHDLSAPLVLVGVGLTIGLLPDVEYFIDLALDPEVVLYVVLPPLLWTAGLESSSVSMRANKRPIALLAVALPLLTTAVVGFVAYRTVPEMTLAAAFVLGAIVAPPDAVSAGAIGRRLGLPRRTMTLISGESLLNDATALTAYKVALAAAIGASTGVSKGLTTFVMAVVGGVVVGFVLGKTLVYIRSHLDDPTAESAIGLVAPFLVYLVAEQIHGSGVLAVVVAALIAAQRFSHAGYAIRLQDDAVWRAVQLVLESFAFLLIGLQLPTAIDELDGISAGEIVVASVSVLATVILVRVLWMYPFAYLPRLLSAKIRASEPAPDPRQVLIVAWAGMRGVVSLAAAFAVPLTTLTGDGFPGRPQIIFLTFIVVVGTLLLHGLTLPWLIRRLDVRSDQARLDATAAAAAQEKAARAADELLDQLLADAAADLDEQTAKVLRAWNNRRQWSAWERVEDRTAESSMAAFRELRLQMLGAERKAFLAERDVGNIDDEVLSKLLHGIDLEEAMLTR
ncbi:Na+/H+ antiporter [Mycolicibacterium vaccae]|jgi:Na+/H+ antiporter|uniref:Na+ antiporter n=1 Tax=Mycolicibacterium vaccae ATCC 25954 TaxID=1194972 RepID=K0UPC3_MYCVA|nr:Na+/H+ antiporter [Mycolicibacterium vaccae]ANI37783.1 sodium/hydrogen exchanger [Mycolicibacterium vaccae 95051]EJZ08721.1 Na+ antiporter [Mycolicibacterium vaccae ATCC 25954]MCV7060793.1 Na+/H+ antiporter [Mycolicibacterium vaccae]